MLDAPLAPDAPAFLPDLDSYDHVLVAFSGGKDSIALVAHVLALGVPRERIELCTTTLTATAPASWTGR